MKTILVPIDYSENSQHALRFALYLLEKSSQLRLIVVHSVEILIPTSTPQHLYKEYYQEQFDAKLAELKAETAKAIEASELDIAPNKVEYVLKDAFHLDDALVETAKERAAELIIMGTLGASGLKKVFVGSNTAKVIDKSEIPVLAIPAGYALGPIKKIAYASDLKDVVTEVGALVKLAQFFEASIEIFHVYPSYPQWSDASKENLEKLSTQLHEKYKEQKFNIHIVQTYKENETVYGIKKFIDSYKPDMLAMFTVKRTFWDKLFDPSHTEEVAFDTNIPLLTLKKQ